MGNVSSALSMSVHTAPSLLVLLLLSLCKNIHSQQLPGIDAWQAAIQQHSLAQGQVQPVDSSQGEVPGLAAWKAHQRAVLDHERRLEQAKQNGVGEKIVEGEIVDTKKSKEVSAKKKDFNEAIKASIKKLVSKLSGEKVESSKTKSDIEKLLEKSKQKSIKEEEREESFLDKLLQIYSEEERAKALEQAGKPDPIIESLERRRRKKLKELRRKKQNSRLQHLLDYDLPLRRTSLLKHPLRVLSGDYLDILENEDDYDDYEDYDFIRTRPFRTSSRSKLSNAARESLLIERQLSRLLRNS